MQPVGGNKITNDTARNLSICLIHYGTKRALSASKQEVMFFFFKCQYKILVGLKNCPTSVLT